MIGEWGGYYGNGINVENSFLVDMGAQMTNTGAALDCGFTDLPATVLRPHQITSSMNGVRIACSSIVNPGPHDFPLYFDSTNASLLAGVALVDTTPLTSLPRPCPIRRHHARRSGGHEPELVDRILMVAAQR